MGWTIFITVIATTLTIFIYDWISGYPASDAVKDFFAKLFGQVASFAEARFNRAKAIVEKAGQRS